MSDFLTLIGAHFDYTTQAAVAWVTFRYKQIVSYSYGGSEYLCVSAGLCFGFHFVCLPCHAAHTHHINLDSAMSSIFIDPGPRWRLLLLFRPGGPPPTCDPTSVRVGFMEEQVRHIFYIHSFSVLYLFFYACARWLYFTVSPIPKKITKNKTSFGPHSCLFACAFHAADKHFENGGHDRLITFYEQLFSSVFGSLFSFITFVAFVLLIIKQSGSGRKEIWHCG